MFRPPSPARLSLVLLLLCASAATSQADPRWWWSDQQLTFTTQDSLTPHVAGSSMEGALIQGGAIFVTYAELDPAEGDTEIWALASFDGGCSFCAPTRLTDNSVDDTNPRVASLIDSATTMFSFGVAYESAAGVQLAWDVDRIPAFDSPQVQCAAFEQMGPAVIAAAQYLDFGAPGSIADSPDLVALGDFNNQEFHLVWHDTRNADDDVYHARDLTGRQGPGWLVSPPRNLTPGGPGAPAAVRPRIAISAFTDVDPALRDTMALDLVFVDESTGAVMALRSVDDGDSFSPDGQTMDAPARRLSDAGAQAGSVALSATGLPWPSDHWVATAWDESSAGGPSPEVRLDGRYFADPVVPGPDWQDPDARLASPAGVAESLPVVGIQANFGMGDVPVWTAWQDERDGAREIFAHAARLQAVGGIDTGAYPFPPVRPLDPTTSATHRLTHCTVDESTFACVDDRLAGEAGHPSLIADFENVFVVFADTRDGASNLYFKRTDRWVWGSAPVLSSVCTDAVTTRVDVEFNVQPSCPAPFSGERMLRYRLYHGPTPGGPYDNAAAPIEFAHDPALGSRVRTRIEGFAAGEDVCVIMVPEDEALNVSPQDFDPAVATGFSPGNETCITTNVACSPSLRVSCASVGDRCPAVPALDDDGNPQPGELIAMEIRVYNAGSAPATDWSGTLTATGAAVIAPAGGLLSLASIPPGESRLVSALLELPRLADGATCGDPVDVGVTAQSSNGGMSWPDAALAGCDFSLGPDPGCVDCTASAALVVRSVTVSGDSCSLGAGNADGVLDPGESALLRVEIENAGSLIAGGVTARLELLAGAVTSDPLAVGPVDLAPGEVHVALLNLSVTASCGDLVQAALRDLATSDGLSFDDAVGPAFRVGSGELPVVKRYESTTFFAVPDGGTAEGAPLSSFEDPAVDRAVLEIQGWFANRPNVSAQLEGPAGTLDVSSALDAPLDITSEYGTVLGGAGTYVLRVTELAPDAEEAQVWNWSLQIDDTAATCNDCVAAPPCLHRMDVTALRPHAPARASVYLPIRSGEDLGIAGSAIACPFASGDREPDASALANGIALSLYQVNRPGVVLRLSKDAGTIRFTF